MESGSLLLEIILAVILVTFIVIAIIIDSRNSRRKRLSDQDIREEIHARIEKRVKSGKKKNK
jgi:C4-dicarboxylate-specific signal transduction histidine kinase